MQEPICESSKELLAKTSFITNCRQDDENVSQRYTTDLVGDQVVALERPAPEKNKPGRRGKKRVSCNESRAQHHPGEQRGQSSRRQ